MTNEEYQRLLRATPEHLREGLPGSGGGRHEVARLISSLSDDELRRAVGDLGGHDLSALLDAYRQADAVVDRPTVIFAYTIKAWRLATQGHPGNHSALLTTDQWRELATELGADADDPWRGFEPDSSAGRLCAAAAERLRRPVVEPRPAPSLPTETGRTHRASASTQQAFGRFFLDLLRVAPDAARHVVTVSPDVASSTNLGGWINKVGIWSVGDRIDWFADDPDRLVSWRESTHGQHIELGIAEGNLVGALSELGVTWSRDGQPLFPIGTLYDPFVNRALEPWSFGIYAGAQSILVGTPSGVTLASEGGAHQSIITPVGRPRTARLCGLGAGLRAGFRVDVPACDEPAGPSRRHQLVLPADDPGARPVPGRGARGSGGARAAAAAGGGGRLSDPHRTGPPRGHAGRGGGDHARMPGGGRHTDRRRHRAWMSCV